MLQECLLAKRGVQGSYNVCKEKYQNILDLDLQFVQDQRGQNTNLLVWYQELTQDDKAASAPNCFFLHPST